MPQEGMQYDEQGRPYFMLQNGQRSYVSPVAMGQDAPEDDTGILHERPQWNQDTGQWDTPFDWGNALSIGTGVALTGGVLGAAMAGGGGAAGAGTGAGVAGVESSVPFGAITGSLGTPSVVGAGTSAGAGTGSILGTAGKYAGKLAPILGNAAAGRAEGEQAQFDNSLKREQLELQRPRVEMANIARSELGQADPVSAKWGGPGSGLRGETVQFAGGANTPHSPESKAAMKALMDQAIQRVLHREDQDPNLDPNRTSKVDKILGYGSTAASILGAFK